MCLIFKKYDNAELIKGYVIWEALSRTYTEQPLSSSLKKKITTSWATFEIVEKLQNFLPSHHYFDFWAKKMAWWHWSFSFSQGERQAQHLDIPNEASDVPKRINQLALRYRIRYQNGHTSYQSILRWVKSEPICTFSTFSAKPNRSLYCGIRTRTKLVTSSSQGFTDQSCNQTEHRCR